MSIFRLQRTICQPVAVTGFGYWSGQDVRVEFHPAAVGTGITFVRDDLGGAVSIPARVEFRVDTPRRTNLVCNGVEVQMVEHVMAALAGLQIDNCEIVVNRAEMPGCDGSALAFVRALDGAGIVEQEAEVPRLEVAEYVRLEDGESWIEAHPSPAGSYSVQFEVFYPHDSAIGRQSSAFQVTPEQFRRDIAPCRTFVLQREADEMIRRGLGTRVSPQDLLLFDEQGPVENQLRFRNECARHKALDVIGDLALTGCAISGSIVAYRSGHRLNAALARELQARFVDAAPLRAIA